jgi:hypothetical protein
MMSTNCIYHHHHLPLRINQVTENIQTGISSLKLERERERESERQTERGINTAIKLSNPVRCQKMTILLNWKKCTRLKKGVRKCRAMHDKEYARGKEYTINEARRGIRYTKIKEHRMRGSQI